MPNTFSMTFFISAFSAPDESLLATIVVSDVVSELAAAFAEPWPHAAEEPMASAPGTSRAVASKRRIVVELGCIIRVLLRSARIPKFYGTQRKGLHEIGGLPVTGASVRRSMCIMNVFTRAILVAGLSLTAGFGCSDSKESHSEGQSEVTAGDVQGLAEETLLVLKFHHDK